MEPPPVKSMNLTPDEIQKKKLLRADLNLGSKSIILAS